MTNVDKSGGQPIVQQTQAKQKIKRTKEQIGKVVHTIMQLVPNDAATKTKIARIAQELYDYADTHNGAVGKSEFTKLLKEITPENVVGVIMKYNNEVSPDESIVEMMLDEVASSHDDIREALLGQGDGKNQLRGLFTVLLDRAKAVGMDDATIKSYRKQFETQLNKELGRAAFLRSSAKMDEIINTVIQSIRNHIEENNKAAKANGSQKTVPAKAHETKATNTIVARYNKALKDFNNQLKADGWAEDIADAMGRLWGKNYADAVRKDLKIAKEQVNRLKAALTKGDEAFRAEFLNIFGVAYDPANITAYQNAENAYTTALKAKSNEDSFNQAFNVLLKKGELKAEYETLTYPDTGVRTTATKEQVYQREFKKVAELFDATVKSDKSGQFALLGVTDGKSYVEKAIESAGAKDKSIDEKFKVLQNIAGKISQSLAQETKKACGGRSFASIQQQYENCYKAAYGLENDILKRVTDYNISQQKGGGAVKGAAVAIAAIGIGMLTAGGGTAAIAGGTGAATTAGATGGTVVAGALKGAATVSALTALTELSNKLSSKNGLRPEDIGQIAQASLVSGTMCLMFAGQSYAITNLTLKAATAAGMGAEAAGYTAAALSTAGFVGTGLGTEYVFQGEISVEGATFTVIMALVSGVMQVKQVYQNARAAEAQIREKTMQDIANARKQLGFADDEVINLDKAEKAYKEIAKLHHPNSAARTGDGAMHDAIFAAAQNAIEVLRKNAMSINATVTQQVTNPQPAQPSQPKANPSHIPTAEDGAIVPISHYQTQQTTNVGVYPITANGVNLNKTITNANNAVVTSETEIVGESTITNGKDANGNIVRTTLDNGVIKSVQYMDGNNTVSQIMVNDELVAHYIVNANGKGVYTDATGQVITESHYNRLVSDAVNGQTDPVNMPLTPAQNNGATVVELNPQVSAVAASSSGPVANPSAVPSQVTGGAAPTENVYEPVLDNGVGRSNTEIRATYEAVEDVGTLIKEYNFHKQAGGQELKLTILEDVINQRMTNIAEQARASVVTTDNSELNGMQVTTSKDANGTPVVTTTSTQLHNNKVVAQNVYNSNGISVSETTVDGKVIGSYITTGGEDGVYIDHYGYIITESQFNDAVSTAVAEPAPADAKKPYVKPEITEASATPQTEVLASSPRTSSDYLSTSNRLLHPKNYALAKQLSDAGLNVEIYSGGSFNVSIPFHPSRMQGVSLRESTYELDGSIGRESNNIELRATINPEQSAITVSGNVEDFYMYESEHALANDILDALVDKFTVNGKTDIRTGLDEFLDTTLATAKQVDSFALENIKDRVLNQLWQQDNFFNMSEAEITDSVLYFTMNDNLTERDVASIVQAAQNRQDEMLIDSMEVEAVAEDGVVTVVPDDEVTATPVSDAYAKLLDKPLSVTLPDNSEIVRTEISEDKFKISHRPSGGFIGNAMENGKPVVVDGNAGFRLAGTVELNLSEPSIKAVLDGLLPGEEISVGRNGMIKIKNAPSSVSREHLTIKKLADNSYEVTDKSKFGTEIQLEQAPTEPKKPYVKPEMTQTSVKPEGEVMASSPRTSSSYLDFTDRIMHRTEYKLAKQLQEQGMEVKFGVDGKYSIEIDASQFDGLELLDGNYYHELYDGYTVFEYSYKDGKLVITGQKAGGFASDAERMQFALDMRTKGASYSNQYATGGKTVNTRSINEIIQSNIDKAKHSSQVLKDNGVTVTKFNHGDAARYKGDTYAPAEIRFTQNGKEYVGEYRGNNVEIIPKSDLEGMLADAIEGKSTDKFAIKEFDHATGKYKPVENISQTFAENKPRELKLPSVSGSTQADIVEGWRDFVRESKAVINSATSIDELRTLRNQIKNVENKQAAQELREAYVLKEQALREALPESTKSIENMYRPTDLNQSTSSVSSSSVYQQLQKEPLILPGEDNRTRVYSPAARSEVIHTPTTGFKDKRLQIAKHYVVDSQAHFRLDGWFELQLNSPEIKNILDGLNPGEEITVGKQGHIKNENLYTKKHLTIKKLSDNQFEITPLGICGTEISTETTVTDAKAKISGTNNKKSYEKPQTTVMSYSMESDLMASDVQTTKYNSNQERILAEAGFSDGVIDDIIANGPWGNPKVDAALVEEVKNMVIWMEGEIANGATVNRTLIETAINTFSPGASGGSAACQRSILANYWNRGTEVYNAYGQKAPDQSTFSWGNLKAKWNKVKNSVKEFYDYKKWELTGKDSGVPRANTEQFSEWSTEKLMDEFNARFNYGIKDGTTELRAVLTERGYVPNENGYYLTEQITPEDVAAHPGQVTGGSAPAAEGWAEESLNTQLAFGKVGTALQEGLSQLVVKSDVPQAAQDVHAKIVNGNFGAFGSKSASQVGAELKAYAEQNGLKFIERGSEFELQDANGNVVREAHEGFFDGQWYDHHQTFNADNKITNRFVVDHNGKLQSTVEYFYDENGNQTMSVGYGGKSGTDIMVFEGSNRSQLTIQQFIEKYGFEPTFYREINPNVEFKSPIKNPVPVSSVQEMEQIIADDYKADTAAGNKAAIALGESLTNPSFPTEFNETTFKAWADANGLTLSIEKGIALFRDADGNVVRRITNDYNHSGQVYDDHVVLYENGKEVAKFIKYTDEANIKYYYNYSETQGRYTGKAELRPDGSWYDLNTGIKLDKSPVTARPNTVSSSAKPSNNIPSTPVPTPKEAIFDFDYSSEWNPSKLQAWADKNGLTLNYIDNNRIAVFKDSNGHVVRRVTQDWSDKTKVYDDKRAIYDKDGNLIGQLDKYMDEAEPEYSFKQPGQTQKTYAKLGSDGLWYENKFVDGRFEKEILPTNPITGMPQVTGVNPEAKVELQVHEVKPAPASFENAGVPETTLSASYVENLRASDSSSKFMSNIDNITKRALGEGRIRQSFYDKVQNAKTTEDLANCISDISSDTEGVYIQKIIELTSKAEPGKAQLKQLANDANTVRNIYSDCNVYAIRGSKNITELKPVIEEFAQQHGYTVESGKDDWGFDCVKVKNTAGKTIREVSADIRGNILEDEWFTYDANGNVVRNVSYDRGGEPSTIIQHYYENGVETHSTGVDKGRDIAKVYVYENGEPSVSYMHSDKVKATFGHELEGKELLDEPQQSSVPVDQATPKEATEVTDKKAYVTPEITETSAAPQEDVLASDGTSSSGLWSRFKKAIGIDSSNKSLDQVLETARKEGALVEELGNGEYRVTQRKAWKDGKTYNVGAQAKEYHTETVETYKDGNPEPVDVIRYSHDNWSNRQEAVVQRTMRDENGVTHYILDRSSGYGVEYSGYDTNGNKVPGKDQIVRVIDKDNKVLAEYTGEDIENALLVPSRNNTDSHAQPLLDVKHAISNSGISMNIVGWQATDGTGYLISSGQRFKPENFVKPVSEENIQEYTDVTLETPAFSEKSAEYNEFARTRNLTITEETSDNGKNIQFKDAKGHVVRSVTADKNGTGISTDEFFELNRDGDIVQSATRDGSGKIISRTVNEYRAFWGKACTVTLDYINGEAHSGLWLRGNLTNQQTVNLESGIALFRDYAGR